MQNNKIRQIGRDGINKIKLQGGTKCNWKQARGVLASNVTGLRSPGHKVQMSFLSPQETTKQGRDYDHTPQTLIRFHNQHPKTLELKKCLESCKNKIKLKKKFPIARSPSVLPRRFWHRHQRLGRRRCSPLQEVPPQQPSGGSSAVARLVPPVAREALRRRAPARPVPHVHAVQGHERGLARPAGDALLQARDWSSPPQAETAAKLER